MALSSCQRFGSREAQKGQGGVWLELLQMPFLGPLSPNTGTWPRAKLRSALEEGQGTLPVSLSPQTSDKEEMLGGNEDPDLG